MGHLVVKGGRVIDPAENRDEIADILVDQDLGKILAIGPELSGGEILDAAGKLVCPGFIDIHAHFREPGFTGKETISTGSAAAVHGGFTAVVTMPNTDPPLDNPSAIAYQYLQADKAGKARLFPMGCLTKGRGGTELAELGLLARSGAVAFTDDGSPVHDSFVLRSALEYAHTLGKVVVEHCEDLALSQDSVIHEGKVSAALGINGYPSAAEEIVVARDIRLAKLAHARLHICHLSAKGSVQLVREAKRRGVKVTAEATPHHLLLTDEACRTFDPVYKMNPPLREPSDVNSLIEGLADGTIDCLATDHAPHGSEEKSLEFVNSPHGVIGLESAIGVVFSRLVLSGRLPLQRFIEVWTAGPARVLGLPGGRLVPGGPADITILDPAVEWILDVTQFRSKARNCPFHGWPLKGGPVWTLVGGKPFPAIAQTNTSNSK